MRSCTECQEMTPLAELTSVLSGHICQSCLRGLAVPDLSASFQRQADAAKSKACSKCLETKPVEEFSKNRAKKDGKHNYCRECARESARAYRERARQANLAGTPLIIRTEKTCPKCEETKPLQEFHRRRSAGDGREPACKECKRERVAVYYQSNTEYSRKLRRARGSQYQESSSLLATKSGGVEQRGRRAAHQTLRDSHCVSVRDYFGEGIQVGRLKNPPHPQEAFDKPKLTI